MTNSSFFRSADSRRFCVLVCVCGSAWLHGAWPISPAAATPWQRTGKTQAGEPSREQLGGPLGPGFGAAEVRAGGAVPGLERMLAAGEYTLALAATASSEPSAVHPQRGQVLAHQRDYRAWEQAVWRGTSPQAGARVRVASEHDLGSDASGGLASSQSGDRSEAGRAPLGPAGGMMQADFTSLINLIQTTVDPNSWEENGGTGVITTFPNGVLIDVAGKLSFAAGRKTAVDRSAVWQTEPREWVTPSQQRFLSLPKLEATVRHLAATGQPLPESLAYLGGLYEVNSVAIDPQSGDLFLVGPAGPWVVNAEGVAINRATGRSVLHLDDLVACLRTVFQGRGVFGCSIDPRPGQFQQAAALAGKWNLTLPQVREKFLTAVGPQDTVVFGVPSTSHAAQVLLTADYHIKLLAMGSVKAGPRLPSYLERCQVDDPPTEIIRWWFTVADPVVAHDENRSLYHLQGPYMELQTEAQLLAGRAAGADAPPRSVAAEAFVRDFNRQLPELRRTVPIYGQLENLFQLAVVAQLIKSQDLAAQVGWEPTFFLGRPAAEGLSGRYALRSYPEIKEVQLVINHRTLQARGTQPVDRTGAGQLKRQTIVAISGGVEIKLPAERLEAALQIQAPNSDSFETRQGLEKSRAILAPRAIGPTEGTATLPGPLWFADGATPR